MGWFECGVARDKVKEFLVARFKLGRGGGGGVFHFCAANQLNETVPATVPVTVPEKRARKLVVTL